MITRQKPQKEYGIRTMLNVGHSISEVAKAYKMTRLQVAKMLPQTPHKGSEIPELAEVKADYAENGEFSDSNRRAIVDRYTAGYARILPYATQPQIAEYIGCPVQNISRICEAWRVLTAAERLLKAAA